MKKKPLSELTLLDKFLFDETMDCPEAHQAALQIILGQEELKLLTESQTEKEVRTTPWLRSIRLDVYAIGDDGTVYDTEMQAGYRTDLPKRSRYYQGLIDASLLEPGVTDFNLLNGACVIMITPFDLFGQEKYRYTFRERCDEVNSLALNDGAVRIFLNTQGKNDSEVSKELVDFLHYIQCTDEEFANKTDSERIKKIHSCVSRIKASEKVGVKYMQRWEEEIILKDEERVRTIKKLMKNLNLTVEQAMAAMEIPEREYRKYMRLLESE
ncbi:MAG: Rpn family recombination-promoting nuclease/putative transposase [Lachnospiraceae bacterium]|nr:Rpn family recombination-promoting nuclease/putative transposase [Lachnospiraceae bacterium]